MHTYVHLYIYTYIGLQTCVYLATYAHKYMYSYMYACTYTCLHTHIHTNSWMCVHIHKCIYTCKDMYTLKHIWYIHTHSSMSACTHTHTHTHIYIYIYIYIYIWCCAVKFPTNHEKYTLWDAFVISQADLTLLVSLTKWKKNSFPCLQDNMPYLGQGKECALAWAQTALRLRKVRAFCSLPSTNLHIGLLYLLLEAGISWYLFLVTLTDYKYFIMNKASKSTTSKDNCTVSNSPVSRKVSNMAVESLALPS